MINNSLLITFTFDAYAFHSVKSAAFFSPFVWWDTLYRVFIRQQSRFRDPLYRPLPPEKWKLTCKHWAMEKSGELRRILMVVKSIFVMAKNKRELKQYCTLFFILSQHVRLNFHSLTSTDSYRFDFCCSAGVFWNLPASPKHYGVLDVLADFRSFCQLEKLGCTCQCPLMTNFLKQILAKIY